MKADPKMWPSLFERFPRVALVCVLAGLPTLAVATGCGPAPDLVELRLFPCDVDGQQPRAVLVEITGYDAAGEIVEVFEVGFDNIDAAVFDDGYASVGYRSDASVVSADVRLGWFMEVSAGSFAEAHSIAVLAGVNVPVHGDVIELGDGSGDCSEVAGDGDGDTSGDGDGDTSGDGDGDGDTSGDGDGDSSGDGDGDSSGDGDGDGDSGDGDGDGDTSGDGDGDGDTSGDGDGDPGVPVPMPGDECGMQAQVSCSPSPGGQAGTPLICGPGLTLEDFDNYATGACPGLCPNGTTVPVQGCAGFDYPNYCLCELNLPESCDGAQLGCNGDRVRLCFEGDVVEADCPACAIEGEFYSCGEF